MNKILIGAAIGGGAVLIIAAMMNKGSKKTTTTTTPPTDQPGTSQPQVASRRRGHRNKSFRINAG